MSRPFTLKEIQQVIGGELVGNPNLPLMGVAGLEDAEEGQLSFLANPRYTALVPKTKAGAVILPREAPLPPSGNAIIHTNPSGAFQKLIETYKKTLPPQTYFKGVHPQASIGEGVILGKDVSIGPFAVIEQGTKIGDRTTIAPHTYIGPAVTIGNDCIIHPHVTIREGVTLGNRVILQPGAVIGSCGFGYLPDEKGHYQKLDQLGAVEIEDDVEIGANSTIDRARFAKTSIGRGTKIDNLVQIAHNVKIGKDCILVSGVAVAGSTEIGDCVTLMANVAVNGHIKVAPNTRVSACSVIQAPIRESGDYGGYPLVPIQTFRRNYVVSKDLAKRLHEIEKKLNVK